MSRIGKNPITVPSGVEITITGQTVKVKGSKGELSYEVAPNITVLYADSVITIKRKGEDPKIRSLHGLTRALLQNMVKGVSEGFTKKLEIIGVGYRAAVSGRKVTLNLGFSHPVELEAPAGVSVELDKEQKNVLVISGIDRQQVGQFAANIRSYREPEPYKGKGIRYVGEYVARKAGKAAAGAKS